MNGYYILKSTEEATAYGKMNNEAVKKLWNSFYLKSGNICFKNSNEYIFRIGTTSIPNLPEGKEFALAADENGICIFGKDYGALMRGFFSLLLKFEYENGLVKIKYTKEESSYTIANRMIHICVFPENDLYFIKKLIRFAALCQYTHIVIEFWGMLKYECLSALSWSNAFTKDEAKELTSECRALGIEPIPMFNQLGHASGSRRCYGKHVVLDQAPELQELFTPDGWAWNICSDKTKALLKQVRGELYEVFKDSNYIHIGCDEAYYITHSDELRKQLPEYLKQLTYEAENEGKRPMLWMDMLLEEGKYENCYCTGKASEISLLQGSLAKSTVFVDWQYDCRSVPVPSLEALLDSGHDCIGAPWLEKENYKAHIDTVVKNNMFGIMLTTWHTLKENMHNVLSCAKLCGAKGFVWESNSEDYEQTAVLFRRASYDVNSYEDCGWAKKQIEI